MQAIAMNHLVTRPARRKPSMRARRRRTLFVVGLLVILAALVLAPRTVFMLGRSEAPALVTYRVAPGETLWEIASKYAGGRDVRKVIYTIKQANQLQTAQVHPGQELVIPQAR